MPPDLDSLLLPLQKTLLELTWCAHSCVYITVPTRQWGHVYDIHTMPNYGKILQETWQDYAIYLGNFLSYIILSKTHKTWQDPS